MRLDELIACCSASLPHPQAGTQTPRRHSHRLAYDSRAVRQERCSSACRGFRSDGHDFAAQAVADGRCRAGRRAAAWTWACPRCWSGRCARRWRRMAARFYGDPSRRAAGRRASRAPTARRPPPISCGRCLQARGTQCGLLGTVKSVIGGRRARRSAHHPRGDRPAGGPAGDARRRRSGLRDGGLLARAGARARRRGRSSPPRCSPT